MLGKAGPVEIHPSVTFLYGIADGAVQLLKTASFYNDFSVILDCSFS